MGLRSLKFTPYKAGSETPDTIAPIPADNAAIRISLSFVLAATAKHAPPSEILCKIHPGRNTLSLPTLVRSSVIGATINILTPIITKNGCVAAIIPGANPPT